MWVPQELAPVACHNLTQVKYLVAWCRYHAVGSGYDRFAKVLLKSSKIDLEVKNKHGATALM